MPPTLRCPLRPVSPWLVDSLRKTFSVSSTLPF
jgi:hypothetical protein